MLSKEDAEQILEALKMRPTHAMDPLKAQEVEALIILEVDTNVNLDDVNVLRRAGVCWATEA